MEIKGTGIGQGVAVGPVVRMSERLPEPVDRPSHLDPEREAERAKASMSVVAEELARRGQQAGGAAQDVLEAQAMMAEDPTLVDDVVKRLAEGKTAERAVFEAFAAFRDLLVAMGGYMGERATDLDDVSQRVVAHLLKLPAPGVPNPGHPFVLVARDLAPADTAMLDLAQVLGLVTSDGGPTSHTAILAREKSIVAVVGAADAASLADGDTVIVDAANDLVVHDPSPEQVADATARIAERAAREAAPVTPGVLADGTAVPLLANLGSADGAADAVKLGAEGVGLFRTEFLFLDANTAPSVREQQEQYTRLLAAFPGRKVVVRVLDAGADKPLAFLNANKEENPALGLRGIRALRHSEVILREQLTALAAADAATDAEALGDGADDRDGRRDPVLHGALRRSSASEYAGVMVETPSAALVADRMLDVAATSRRSAPTTSRSTRWPPTGCSAPSRTCRIPWHPAVLRLVGEVGAAGAARGKPVGICGEAAADPLLAVVLVGLGATSLSMSAIGTRRRPRLPRAVQPARMPSASPGQPWPQRERPRRSRPPTCGRRRIRTHPHPGTSVP